MGSSRAKIGDLLDRDLDEIADLINRQEHASALSKINILLGREPRFTDESRGRLHVYSAEASLYTSSYKQGLNEATSAINCLKFSAAHKFYGNAKYIRAIIFVELGQLANAVDDFHEAAFTFRRIDDTEGEINSCNYMARCAFIQGHYARASEHMGRGIDLCEKSGNRIRRSAFIGNRGRILALMGDIRPAVESLKADLKLVSAIKPVNQCNREGFLGYLLVLMRSFDEAGSHLEKSLAIAEENSFNREISIYHEYAGELAFWQGQYDQAEIHYRKAIEIGMKIAPEGDIISQSYRLLAELQVERNQLDDAEKSCDRAWTVAEKITERLELGAIQRVRGEIAARRGDAEAAREAFEKSISILGEIGAKYELARAHLQAGEAEVFASHQYRLVNLFAARGLFNRIGVTYWQDRVAEAISRIVRAESESIEPPAIMTCRDNGNAPFIAASEPMLSLLATVDKVKNTDLTILLLGETGTGKDHLARHIHDTSNRADQPFISVCAVNIPDHLWESELFGHVKGAFTGATHDKAGILERAAGGTVYLNEISEIPLSLQAKMLDFLESKKFHRIGGSADIALDVRFIAASNRNLKEEVAAGRFRKDLYFRLAGLPIELPPLRERNGDLDKLAIHFLHRYNYPPHKIDYLLQSGFIDRLKGAVWPGNVRQLQQVIRRLVVLANGAGVEQIVPIANEILAVDGILPDPAKDDLIARLTINNWNQRKTAREMGISEGTLRRSMKRLRISRPSEE